MEGYPGYYDDPEPEPTSSGSLFKTYVAVKPVTDPVEKTGFISDMGNMFASPFKSVYSGIGNAVENVKGTVRNSFLYLVGGILLIGVLTLVLIGAASKFTGRIQV